MPRRPPVVCTWLHSLGRRKRYWSATATRPAAKRFCTSGRIQFNTTNHMIRENCPLGCDFMQLFVVIGLRFYGAQHNVFLCVCVCLRAHGVVQQHDVTIMLCRACEFVSVRTCNSNKWDGSEAPHQHWNQTNIAKCIASPRENPERKYHFETH